MRTAIALVSFVLFMTALEVKGTHPVLAAADQTWSGIISDSSCKDDHGGEIDPRECTAKCIRNGERYVLMAGGGTKLMEIANQDFPDLPGHAGQTVTVTGELRGEAIFIKAMK